MFQLNGIEWEIVKVSPLCPALFRSDGSLSIGACDNNTRTIYINRNLTNNKLRKVLTHEITHAAMFSYKVYMTVDQEELLADLIATYGGEIIDVTNRIFYKIKGKCD